MQGGSEKLMRIVTRGAPGILRGTVKTMLRAILTDSHFWVPFLVLGLGVMLLLRLV